MQNHTKRNVRTFFIFQEKILSIVITLKSFYELESTVDAELRQLKSCRSFTHDSEGRSLQLLLIQIIYMFTEEIVPYFLCPIYKDSRVSRRTGGNSPLLPKKRGKAAEEAETGRSLSSINNFSLVIENNLYFFKM